MKTSSSVGWVKEIDLILIPSSEDIWKIWGITSVPFEVKRVNFESSSLIFLINSIFLSSSKNES